MHVVYENHLIQKQPIRKRRNKKDNNHHISSSKNNHIILQNRFNRLHIALTYLLTLIVKVQLYQNDFNCGLESGVMKRMGVFFVAVITVVISCRFVQYNIFSAGNR